MKDLGIYSTEKVKKDQCVVWIL